MMIKSLLFGLACLLGLLGCGPYHQYSVQIKYDKGSAQIKHYSWETNNPSDAYGGISGTVEGKTKDVATLKAVFEALRYVVIISSDEPK